MRVESKIFGEVTVEDEKVICFEQGIIGLPDFIKYILLYDEEKEEANVSWLQSVDEPALAIPVLNPYLILEDYNPVVEDEWLHSLGEFSEDSLAVLVSVTVPEQIEKMTVNLRAPFIINTKNNKACQLITEGDAGLIKYPVYDILKKKGGE